MAQALLLSPETESEHDVPASRPYSLHGTPLLDAGLVTLNGALSTHPSLVSLDLGDCMLGDEAVRLICGMLPPDGAKSGISRDTILRIHFRLREIIHYTIQGQIRTKDLT